MPKNLETAAGIPARAYLFCFVTRSSPPPAPRTHRAPHRFVTLLPGTSAPAGTLLLINLGAHPLWRGYCQNLLFFFPLLSFFIIIFFRQHESRTLQFPVLGRTTPTMVLALESGPQALSISASRCPVRLSPLEWRLDGWIPPLRSPLATQNRSTSPVRSMPA